jgi:hypothetical protein
MGESFKATCALLLIIALMVTAGAWYADQPGQTTWIVRIAAPVIGLLSLAVLLLVHFRRDRVPDFLLAEVGNYFNHRGFCFVVGADEAAGICRVRAWFQNQYERPCVAQIELRPQREFWLTRTGIEPIQLEIPCESAAFGLATRPIALPEKMLGKQHSFDVSASVIYPNGKGRRLRFNDGALVRTTTAFGNAFRTGLTFFGALAGHVVWMKSARVKIQLPETAAQTLPADVRTHVETLWKLGDPAIFLGPEWARF